MSGVQPTASPNPATSGGSGGQQKKAPHHGHPEESNPAPAGHQPAVSLSASLAPVSAGQRLEGQLIGQDADGVPVLRTESGAFLLRSEQALLENLPPNSRIAIQVLTVGNALRAALLSIDGQALHPPPEIALELSRTQLPPLPGAAGPLQGQAEAAADKTAGQVFANLRPGSPLTATVLVPAPELFQGRSSILTGLPYGQNLASSGEGLTAIVPLPSLAAGATAGTTLLLRVLGISPPSTPNVLQTPTPAEPSSPPQGQPAVAGAAGPAASATGVPAGPSGVLAPGAALQPTLPSTSWSATAPESAATQPGSVTGVVTGQDASGLVLLRSPLGILGLQTQAPLQPGTLVTVEVVSQSPPAASSGTAPLIGGNLFFDALDHGQGWPALKDAMEILHALGSHHAPKLIAQTLPTPTVKLASSFLFFLSAVRGGDVRNWVGRDAANMLERAGRGDLLRQLGDDFQQIANLNSEQLGDWRTLLLPFFDGHNLHRLMLFYRHNEHQGGEGGEGDEGTRFVLNLEFSQLGAMQIDGLAQAKRFDLYIRTTAPLAEQIRHDVSALFSEAVSLSGLSGNISFQTVQEFPVSPLEEARSHSERAGLVV